MLCPVAPARSRTASRCDGIRPPVHLGPGRERGLDNALRDARAPEGVAHRPPDGQGVRRSLADQGAARTLRIGDQPMELPALMGAEHPDGIPRLPRRPRMGPAGLGEEAAPVGVVTASALRADG